MTRRLLAVLSLVLLVGVGVRAGDQTTAPSREQLRNKLEWQLKTRHLGWDGRPLAGRRPAWSPVGRGDLHRSEDDDDDPEDWEDGEQQDMPEPVPPEVAWLAAEAALEHSDWIKQAKGDGLDTGDQQQQEKERLQSQDPEQMVDFAKRLTGWRGRQPIGDQMDAIEF